MQINFWAVAVATVAQFVVGGVWYMLFFAKQWGEIHGFDKLSEKQQKVMQAKMGPFYGAQVLVTILTAYILAHFLVALPSENAYKLAFWLWLGFVVPTQVSAVIFGGTEPKWIVRKLAIMAFGSLACLWAGTAVLEWLL